MHKLINICFVLLFLASCSSKLSLQKRRYFKGYHLSSSKSIHKNTNKGPSQAKPKHQVISTQKKVEHSEVHAFSAKKKDSIQVNSELKIKSFLSIKQNKTNITAIHEYPFVFHHKPALIGKTQASYKAIVNEPKTNVWDTVLFVSVCFLAGLFLLITLMYLVLFFSTSANIYLVATTLALIVCLVFFIIMQKMMD